MQKYTHIIWDWNGTLLDDVDWCVTTINIIRKKNGLPVFESVEEYHSVFGFPIKDYYLRAGFDFEKVSFEKLAVEYIDLYHGDGCNFQLFPDAKKVLSKFQARGIRQVILSASERSNLLSQVVPLGIAPYFDEILGISDIYATSKVDIGKAYMNRTKPERALLIGDTTHDKQVADSLGVDCVLVATGHQSKRVLQEAAVVMDCLEDVANLLYIE